MDWVMVKQKLPRGFQKYGLALLVLLVGLGFMAFPRDSGEETVPEQTVSETEISVESRLEEILSQVQNAGKVRVMLTQAAGPETVYQTDDDSSKSGESYTRRSDTVMTSDSQRIQTGLVRQVNPATYLGAVILCQGADQASVRLAITEAVSKVTDLGADQICVLKMK